MKVKLGNILHIKHGYAFKGEYFTDENTGKLVLTPGNFSLKGGFLPTKKFTKEENFPQEFVLKPGDLIVTMTDLSKEIDTIGYSALVPNDNLLYLHNQRIGLVTINDDNYDYAFIYWLMRSKHYQRSIANTSNGATVHHTSPDRIYKYQFDRISLAKQRRIASILSAYDNLIENNNKRIRLLEQMAENLYKEWFVRFRFPGHEKADFENGLPKGWRIGRLSEYGRVETGKTPSMLKQEYYGGEYLFIKTPDMHGNMFVRETEETLSEKGNLSQPKKLLPKGSVMVSCIGSGGVVAINAKQGHTNQQINSIILSDNTNLEWLYFTCKSLKPTIELFGATGATMTNLSKGKFERLKVIEPSYNLRQAFHNKVSSIFDAILKLDEQTSLLSRQRDLLLPRLMSGKLEVKV